jgi:hypothetical protein
LARSNRLLSGASEAASTKGLAEETPGLLDELARIASKAKSNLFVHPKDDGELRLDPPPPRPVHDPAELDLPSKLSRKTSSANGAPFILR